MMLNPVRVTLTPLDFGLKKIYFTKLQFFSLTFSFEFYPVRCMRGFNISILFVIMASPNPIVIGYIDLWLGVLIKRVPFVFKDAFDDIIIICPIAQPSFTGIVQSGIAYFFGEVKYS